MNEVTLTITLNLQNGQVGVSGPIDNKMMAYGMLGAAKDAIFDYGKQQQNRIVQPAAGGFSLPKLD